MPPPRDLPDSGSEPGSPALQTDPLLSKPPGGKAAPESLRGPVPPPPRASLSAAKREVLAVSHSLTITFVYYPRYPGFPPGKCARETGVARIIRYLEPESLKHFCFISYQVPNFYPFFFLCSTDKAYLKYKPTTQAGFVTSVCSRGL